MTGWPGHGFIQKLKLFKRVIKAWNIDTYGHHKAKCSSLKELIASIDEMEESALLSEEDTYRRMEAKVDIMNFCASEETIWIQRSKATWLALEDENTSFFHRCVAANRRRNTIVENILSSSGTSLVTDKAIEKEFITFYEKLYSKKQHRSPLPIIEDWNSISYEQSTAIEVPFTEAEFLRAVNDLGSNKTPGPDGISAEFFKKSWNTIKNDILVVFNNFFKNGRINASLNETYLCLIPKKRCAQYVSDYRPISLTTCLYKVIARVLSERLKSVLPSTITMYQSAFVSNRQILDAVLIANELIDEWDRRRQKGVVLKLDIEKAFDMVDWDFLDDILRVKGFSIVWRRWIRGCISSTNFSIIINGKPRGKSLATRGFRQGDPLSPFLFVLVMDCLSRQLEKASNEGLTN